MTAAPRVLLELPSRQGAFLDRADKAWKGARRLAEELGGTGDDVLLARPGEGRWSAAHCLDHLTRTNRAYRETLSAAFEAGSWPEADPEEELRGSWFGRLFARLMGPDPKLKVKTLDAIRPDEDGVGRAAVAGFVDEVAAWEALTVRARALPLDDIKIVSPLSRLVRLRASDALAVVVNHQARHLVQAQRAREAVEGRPTP